MVCSVMIRGGPPCGITLLLSNLFPQCRWCPMLVMRLWSLRMSNWHMDYGIFAAHCLPATFDGDRRCGRKPCCFTSRSRAWLPGLPYRPRAKCSSRGSSKQVASGATTVFASPCSTMRNLDKPFYLQSLPPRGAPSAPIVS
jgi:hypothetical protein